MKRLLAVALAGALALTVAGPVAGGFPVPGTPPAVPNDGGSGISDGPSWAYCYVNQAGVQIPAFTPTVLCSLTVGPGTWKFTGQASALIENTTGVHGYSLDFAQHAGPAYYGAATGSTGTLPQVFSLSALGIGSFTEATTIDLRWFAGGASSLVASAQFDSGPTTLFVAERLSDSTAVLP